MIATVTTSHLPLGASRVLWTLGHAYARACRLRTFVIAAPEGLWVYSRPGGQPALAGVFAPEDIRAGAYGAYVLLLHLNQPKRWRMRQHAGA